MRAAGVWVDRFTLAALPEASAELTSPLADTPVETVASGLIRLFIVGLALPAGVFTEPLMPALAAGFTAPVEGADAAARAGAQLGQGRGGDDHGAAQRVLIHALSHRGC